MKKLSKKQIGVISATTVILAASPLIVWAITYYSDLRQNAFAPASANIQIKEENKTPNDKQTNKEYQFTLAENGNYHTVKNVAVYDERKKNDEYLKVLLVPSWYDSNGNIVANIDTVTDFRSKALNTDETALEVYNNNKEVILTYLLDTYWKEKWVYNNADGCFYYSGIITPNMTTSTLIREVEISPSVYKATDKYTLHIDVLADAVQKDYNNSIEEKPVRWK